MSHLEGKLVAICRYFVGGSPFRRRPGKSRSTAVGQNLSASLTGQIQSNNGNRFPLLVCLLAFGLLVTSSFGSAHADDFLWTGNGGNNTWSNADNWLNTGNNQTGVPGVNDNVIFDSSVTTAGGNVAQINVTETGHWNLAVGTTTTSHVNNQGTITLAPQSSSVRNLDLVAQAITFDGSGTFVFNDQRSFINFNQNMVRFRTADQSIVNNEEHTFYGDGQFLFNADNQTFTNFGTLHAASARGNGIYGGIYFQSYGASNSRFVNRGNVHVELDSSITFTATKLHSADFGQISFAASVDESRTGIFGMIGGAVEFDLDPTKAGFTDTVALGGFFGTATESVNKPDLALRAANNFQSEGGMFIELLKSRTWLDEFGEPQDHHFRSLPEGSIAFQDNSNPLRITYRAGQGSDIALVSTYHSDVVNFNIAGNSPDANVFFAGTRGDGGPAGSLNYNSFELLRNQQFTLGPTETMTLDNGNGTLIINQGSIFTGNGVVNGNILNSGLIRIPIVQLQTVSQTQGGVIEVSGTNFIGQSLGVSANTYVSFQGSSPSGGWTPTSTLVSNQGTIGWDASLAVTGDFTQTETGALRLFLAGEDAGVNYSQLQIGGQVDLDGTLQIVFDLEKFSIFGYQPEIGQTFDFIVSGDGIVLDWSTLETQVFLTEAGSQWVQGLTLSPYDSGIIGDPDRLLLIDETMFAFSLVDDGRTFRGTLIRSFSAIPEPSSLVVLGLGALFVGLRRRR